MPTSEQTDIMALQRTLEEQARVAGVEPPFYQLHLQAQVPILREAVRVEPNPPLIGRTPYERLWVVINRIVRRVARHGVEPAVQAQNANNVAVGRLLDQLMTIDNTLHAEIVRLRAEERRERS
jgi:aminoglycoside phosphotransferase (APT) family kinase protein